VVPQNAVGAEEVIIDLTQGMLPPHGRISVLLWYLQVAALLNTVISCHCGHVECLQLALAISTRPQLMQ
jgi:hypothetical protein